jgi:hypothetical protein
MVYFRDGIFYYDNDYLFISNCGNKFYYGYNNKFDEKIDFIYNIESGNWKIDGETKEMIFYDLNNNELQRFKLLNINGVPSVKNVFERRRIK